MNDLSQFIDTYIAECFELLEQMESDLLALDPDAAFDKEALNAIFRGAHSIKGGAGAFGFNHIAHFTHVLEALLDDMREEAAPVTAAAIDCLLRARDVVQQMVIAAQAGETLAEDFGAAIMQELEAFASEGASGNNAASAAPQALTRATQPEKQADAAQEETYEIQFTPHKNMLNCGNEPLLVLSELAGLGQASIRCAIEALPAFKQLEADECFLSWNITLITHESKARIEEVFEFVEDECDLCITLKQENTPEQTAQTTEKPAAAPAIKAASGQATTSIRVDIDKVDTLINMVGEIVIAHSFIASQIAHMGGAESSSLARGASEMLQHITELQDAVMAVRMQPVKSIFARMPRLVRDLSAQLGKDIALQLHGEETEVDKTIIEQLADPLTHMIRNSVDHGVEMPDTRLASGKPAQGTIHLSAEHRGGRIVIEIADDGAGINREKVRMKAIEKGIISPSETLSDEATDMLIFAAGFSTADQVSGISGRGVGMDVVKRNIESLGGVVTLENTPQQGSRFSVALPLTLAILDGMIVRCGQEQYIVPINHIIETMRPAASDVNRVAGGQHVVNVRGEFIPLLYLHELLHISGAQSDPSKALVVLLENGSEPLGLVVDELIGQQQVVIKSLEEHADRAEGISGATILGDGKVSLILDIAALPALGGKHRLKMKQSADLTADSFAA